MTAFARIKRNSRRFWHWHGECTTSNRRLRVWVAALVGTTALSKEAFDAVLRKETPMGKIIITCLVVAGLFAAAVEMPNTLAHEGHGKHDGHDHGAIEEPMKSRSNDSDAVITSPPPFETLDKGSSPRIPPAPESVTPDQNQRSYAERDFTFNDGPPSTLPENEGSPNGSSFSPDSFDRSKGSIQRRRTQDNGGFRTQRDALPRFNRPLNDLNSEGCTHNFSCPYQMSNDSSRGYLSREQAPYFMTNEYNCPYNSGHRIDTYMGLHAASDCDDEFSSCEYGGY